MSQREQGNADFQQGKELSDNPHPVYGKDSHDWISGWAEAVDEARADWVRKSNCCVAVIQFALNDEDGHTFLRLWNEGDFDAIRAEWPNAPEAVYIGADPLYVPASDSDD